MANKKSFIKDLVKDANKGLKGDESRLQVASEILDYDLDLRDAISTRIPMLDFHLGGGLFPGRIYEIFGEESHGKSTLSYHLMSGIQNDGNGVNVLLEAESALDKARAQVIGVDPEEVLTQVPEHCEHAFTIISKYIKKIRDAQESLKKDDPNRVDFPIGIFWDTIAASPTKTEVEHAEGKGDKWGGGQMEKPRLIREWLRAVNKVLPKSNAIIILLNQVYEGKSKNPYAGSVLTSPGGRGIRHHASARIFVNRGHAIVEDGKNVGFTMEIRMVKCKQAPTDNMSFKVDLYYSVGLDPVSSLVHYLTENKLVEMTNNGWITVYAGGKEYKEHGVPKLSAAVKKSPELFDVVYYKCLEHMASLSPVMRSRFFTVLDELAKKIGEEPPLEEKWDVYARELKLEVSKESRRFLSIGDALDFILSIRDEIEKKKLTPAKRRKFIHEEYIKSLNSSD